MSGSMGTQFSLCPRRASPPRVVRAAAVRAMPSPGDGRRARASAAAGAASNGPAGEGTPERSTPSPGKVPQRSTAEFRDQALRGLRER